MLSWATTPSTRRRQGTGAPTANPNRERKKQAMSNTKPDQPVPLAMTRSGVSDIQALVFDTYGTVVDWRAGVLEALVALGGSRGLNVDWAAFLSDWQTRPIMDRVNRGELPWMTMEAVHRQAPAAAPAPDGPSPVP